jgi:Exopolysaccharide synthesis, ExoD
MSARAPISTVLGDMLAAAGTEHVTLDWLLGRMGGRSIGIVLLLLSIFGLLPGVPIRGAPFGGAIALRRAGTALAGAFRSPALDDARRGDQARCGGQCAAAERGSACSGATEQRASRACDHAYRLRLSGRGRRITVRCIGHRIDGVSKLSRQQPGHGTGAGCDLQEMS